MSTGKWALHKAWKEREGKGRQGDALWRPSSSVNTLRVTLLSGVMVGFISWNKFLAIGHAAFVEHEQAIP